MSNKNDLKTGPTLCLDSLYISNIVTTGSNRYYWLRPPSTGSSFTTTKLHVLSLSVITLTITTVIQSDVNTQISTFQSAEYTSPC